MARNYPPALTISSLADHDILVDNCLAKICKTDALSWWSEVLRGLPVDLGGISLPRLSQICGPAHVSCIVEALVVLSCRFPDFYIVLREGLSREETLLVSHIVPILREPSGFRIPGEMSSQARDLLDSDGVDLSQQFMVEMKMVRQACLTRQLYMDIYGALRNRLCSEELYTEAALILSASGPKPLSAWLRGGQVPGPFMCLSNGDFVEALCS